jgi:hypothetical protein
VIAQLRLAVVLPRIIAFTQAKNQKPLFFTVRTHAGRIPFWTSKTSKHSCRTPIAATTDDTPLRKEWIDTTKIVVAKSLG